MISEQIPVVGTDAYYNNIEEQTDNFIRCFGEEGINIIKVPASCFEFELDTFIYGKLVKNKYIAVVVEKIFNNPKDLKRFIEEENKTGQLYCAYLFMREYVVPESFEKQERWIFRYYSTSMLKNKQEEVIIEENVLKHFKSSKIINKLKKKVKGFKLCQYQSD